MEVLLHFNQSIFEHVFQETGIDKSRFWNYAENMLINQSGIRPLPNKYPKRGRPRHQEVSRQNLVLLGNDTVGAVIRFG